MPTGSASMACTRHGARLRPHAHASPGPDRLCSGARNTDREIQRSLRRRHAPRAGCRCRTGLAWIHTGKAVARRHRRRGECGKNRRHRTIDARCGASAAALVGRGRAEQSRPRARVARQMDRRYPHAGAESATRSTTQHPADLAMADKFDVAVVNDGFGLDPETIAAAKTAAGQRRLDLQFERTETDCGLLVVENCGQPLRAMARSYADRRPVDPTTAAKAMCRWSSRRATPALQHQHPPGSARYG